jgi:hypothetical protein
VRDRYLLLLQSHHAALVLLLWQTWLLWLRVHHLLRILVLLIPLYCILLIMLWVRALHAWMRTCTVNIYCLHGVAIPRRTSITKMALEEAL